MTTQSAVPARVRKDRFRDNAFGVLGLPFGASQSEIRQRAQQRLVELELRGAPQEDRERIGQALHLLEDPPLRLEEEVYWVHLMPEPVPLDFSPDNYAAMYELQRPLLAHAQTGSDEAEHDLALIRLALAQHTRTNPNRWLAALMSWRRVIDNDSIWDRVALRAGFADDPRVSPEFVSSLRERFRSTGIEVFAGAVTNMIADGADDYARNLFTALTGTSKDWEYSIGSVDDFRHVIGSLVDQLQQAIKGRQWAEIAPEQLVSFWETTAQEVVRLAQRYRRWVEVDIDLVGALDDTALWLRGLSVRLHNEAGRTDLAVNVVDKALAIAVSAATIANLDDASKQLRYQLAQRQALQCAEQGHWKAAEAFAAEALLLAPDSDRAQLLEFQATCVARQSLALAPTPANAVGIGPPLASTATARPGKKWPWAVAAGVGGLILLAIINSGSLSGNGSSSTSTDGTATTSCQSQKAQLKGQMDSMDSQLSASLSWLNGEGAWLNSESTTLDQTRANIDQINARLAAGWTYNMTAVNAYVAQFNSDVAAYNQRLAVYKSTQADYNSMVQQRSALADQYNGLSC